jgi:hypothetical protein
MKRKPLRKEGEAEFRSDSYEASLTPEERQRLHAMLRTKMTIDEVLAESVPWSSGEDAGKKPCWRTLYNIRCRLKLEHMLLNIEWSATIVERTTEKLKALLKGTDAEKTLDVCMALIGQEVITSTMQGLSQEARNAATRLLLKRADQRRVDRRLDIVESEFKKDAPARPDLGLTPEEKEERMKEIFGI